jgi:hypothetical protein
MQIADCQIPGVSTIKLSCQYDISMYNMTVQQCGSRECGSR